MEIAIIFFNPNIKQSASYRGCYSISHYGYVI
jgi:hypothetical protein